MKQDHIIQKVFVEITVNNKEKAYRIKDDINSFLSIDVFPEIEKYINGIEQKLAGHTLQIPRMELNLEVKNSSLNTELKDKIAQLFKEKLSETVQRGETSRQETENDPKAYWVENQEKMVQTFIYFLENGYMPWWNSDKKSIGFLETQTFDTLISAANFSKSIISVLFKQHVQNRIINQLSDEQIARVCLAVLENKELKINLKADIIRRISKLNHPDRIMVWQLVLNMLTEYLRSSNSDLQEYLLHQILKAKLAGLSKVKDNHQNWKTVVAIFPFIKENEIFESIQSIQSSKKNTPDHNGNPRTPEEISNQNNAAIHDDAIANDGQYIRNAGLILIHPFMKTFFEHCELFDPETQQLTDPELCAHLLHYIATGTTNAPEYDMAFEKFLCNIPMNQTINRHIKLSRKHKTQAQNVIESVQYNWNPMKKSSAALLQNEFFQRSGKLVVTDHDYTLTVERKTQDILLEKLGWGIGLVKLPWKEKFMFVNW
ncbi:contractile injection system tape measure protein [Chryseobacterium lineare]